MPQVLNSSEEARATDEVIDSMEAILGAQHNVDVALRGQGLVVVVQLVVLAPQAQTGLGPGQQPRGAPQGGLHVGVVMLQVARHAPR